MIHLTTVGIIPGEIGKVLPFPIEVCDGGREVSYEDFNLIYVDIPDSNWPENFSTIESPWSRRRWNDPWFILEEAGKPKEAGVSEIVLSENASKLYLHVYDNASRHVGFNPETNQVEVEIPDVYYFDLNQTTFIILPSNITDFRVMIDATYAEELEETYTLSIVSTKGGNFADQQTISDKIEQEEKHEFSVRSSEGILELKTRIFYIPWDGKDYPVIILSNSTISNFEFNQPNKEISFDISSRALCNVTIPIELLDGEFEVFLDGNSIEYESSRNATHSIISFYCEEGRVFIRGTTVIPEFPSLWILVLLMTITLFTVAILKFRKRST